MDKKAYGTMYRCAIGSEPVRFIGIYQRADGTWIVGYFRRDKLKRYHAESLFTHVFTDPDSAQHYLDKRAEQMKLVIFSY